MQAFPVTESTLSAAHLAPLLRQHYGFSNAVTCKLFRTGMNHLYMVTDGTAKYVFRIYTCNWRSKTEIEEEVRLLLHLKDAGVHVSYPLATTDGSFILDIDAPEGLRCALLFSYAKGAKSSKFSEHISQQIGIAIAQLHLSTDGFATSRVNYTTEILIADAYAKTSAFFTQPSEEMDFVAAAGKLLCDAYATADATQLRQGSIHLDIWFDNMHFDGDEVTFFDFDFCGNGWLCHDIGYYLYQLYQTNPAEEDYLQKRAAFFKGYESVTPISTEERRVIPYVSTAIMLFYLGIQCERYDTWSNIFLNEDYLKRFTASIKRWMVYNELVGA